ncbi:MAG: sialate O-acetylesterase [Tepidisphaeraceae bacterium]|jgi:sialate O-acetylesterase
MKRVLAAAVCTVASLWSASALADVKMPAIFGDNMVLQVMEARTPVFGKADAGEKVTVKFKGQEAAATADDKGQWKVALDARNAGLEPGELSIAGKNTITFKNVVAGEVWVASGQSNMEMTVQSSKEFDKEKAAADFPQVRMFTVRKAVSLTPVADVQGQWEVCTPQVVGHFSAVGYFFARELNQQLKVPVGVIHTSWGGTPAEAWTSQEALLADETVKSIWTDYEKYQANYPAMEARFKEAVEAWKAAGSARDKQPRGPSPVVGPNSPANLYNAMIAPIVGYGIRGSIWYQGESNAGKAYQYRTLFPTMIKDWRTRWGQGDFPFYFVQLANFMGKDAEPNNSAWAELREAQTMTLKYPNTGMAVIIDIGDEKDIHPKNKQDVGKRLAQWALKKDYGKNVVESGPLYDTMAVEGNSIRLKFKYPGGGLVAKGDRLTGFAIAGEDKKFVWADAKIDGDSIVVSSPKVEKPVAVRYGWGNNPDCNVYNKADLPMSPFRTDEWPGVTAPKK